MAVVNDVPTSHFSTARDIMSGVKYRQLLRKLHDDGWRHDRTTGSHMMYVHPTKPGPVVVPAGGKEGQDVPPGTLNSILKQAGLK